MMMPRMDGLSLAREIKARADLPIIVLSAIDAGDSKADLLEEVAEDYVTKPYHYPELRARINRVLRRLGDKVPRQSLVLGPDLTLDLHRREATVGGQVVQLTPTESRLLYALAANLGQTVTTETLLARGWAETEDADPSYVWVTMRRLRQKVEVDPNRPVHVQTVRGVGYRLRRRRTAERRRRADAGATPTDDGRAADADVDAARRDAFRRPADRSPSSPASVLPLGLASALVVLRPRAIVRRSGHGPRRLGPHPARSRRGRSCCCRRSLAVLSLLLAGRPDRAAAGDRARPSTGSRPATSRPRSRSPATTSSPAWPTATTGWPPTSSVATASSAGSSRRSTRSRRATASRLLVERAAADATDGVRA